MDDGTGRVPGNVHYCEGVEEEKAPGPESIIDEVVKDEVLCFLVNLVMESRYWPDDRRNIVPPFKVGDEEVLVVIRG